MQNEIKTNLQMKKDFDLKVNLKDKNLETSLGEISYYRSQIKNENKDSNMKEFISSTVILYLQNYYIINIILFIL
jgi:hypothetical protein